MHQDSDNLSVGMCDDAHRSLILTMPDSSMFAPESDLMALCLNPTSGFAAFPRELRDVVFSCIGSAAGVEIDSHDNYCLHIGGRDQSFTHCIEMLHKWAPRSYIARGACEVLWSNNTFTHGWCFSSDNIIDPHATLSLMIRKDEIRVKKSVGTPIDLRDCVQKIELYTCPNPGSLAKPTERDLESLLKLQHELSQLCHLSHLRQVKLAIWIPQECDAYFEAMTVVESISDACKKLSERLGAGLTVTLPRAWPYDVFEFEYIDELDISWMWTPPSQTHRQCVRDGTARGHEKMRVLIADGAHTTGESTLLDELRYAALNLPQRKEEIANMDVWESWNGVNETEWKWIKEAWERYDAYL